MPLPSPRDALAIELIEAPYLEAPSSSLSLHEQTVGRWDYRAGVCKVTEWDDEKGKLVPMITDMNGVKARLKPIAAFCRVPDIHLDNAIQRLINFKQIVVNKKTGDVVTRSFDNYDALLFQQDSKPSVRMW